MTKLNIALLSRFAVIAPLLLAAGCTFDNLRPEAHVADAGSIKDTHPPAVAPRRARMASAPARAVVLAKADAQEALAEPRRAPLRSAERRSGGEEPAATIALPAPPPIAATPPAAVPGSTAVAVLGPLAATVPVEPSRSEAAKPLPSQGSVDFVPLIDTPDARPTAAARRAPAWAAPDAAGRSAQNASAPARGKAKESASDPTALAPSIRATLETADLQLRLGHVKGARQMLEESVPVGGAPVMAALARTYDPLELEGLLVPPGTADAAKAVQLYTEAAARGSVEAGQRLQRLQATAKVPKPAN